MNRAVVALGANLGDRLQSLREAVAALDALPDTRVEACSRLYETDPVGYMDQPDFLNAAALLRTRLSPEALLGALLGVEAALGRRRSFANAPRTIDLDLLLMETPEEGGIHRSSCELTLPHPRMWERAFVLLPLSDLFPDGRACGMLFEEKRAAVSAEGVRYFAGPEAFFKKD
ncbi:MAG: 2-amino-4-hydroxy-6-hydroxymethyldihydropteridine diphosphokinase [Clostridiales bacterium]|nr:2-amino-4-hydroxy-6-hydroxymethyldihydropteridine diphosphokinase [Clostridiales bacterium]